MAYLGGRAGDDATSLKSVLPDALLSILVVTGAPNFHVPGKCGGVRGVPAIAHPQDPHRREVVVDIAYRRGECLGLHEICLQPLGGRLSCDQFRTGGI